ncbi:MAG TPA: SIS domain-containing protein [Solirubrobacterales bacterium]|jgi:D-sedoheptulose 7-phosphate isomerase|nr:SIS domain-containing protein [Solirubrobacterales bacterium]
MRAAPLSASDRLGEMIAARSVANREFFAAEADALARLCHRMAERFARGGRLVAVGVSPGARSDVRHVTVEFVHPVIVGKRALPAIGLSREGGPLTGQLELIGEPEDIVIAFGALEPEGEEVRAALGMARERSCLTIAFERGVGAEWELVPASEDPSIRQELVETAYHVLWELVHVFFEHRGLLEGRAAGPVHDSGASSFLYPFLAEAESDLDSVLDDVRASILLKAEETGTLRERTFEAGRETLPAAARALREGFDAGGKVLALGNGGSATDAIDFVADLRYPTRRGWVPRPALDLTEDTAIITALGNDVGNELIFQRQVIAYGREGDALIAFSTSGNSGNVIAALAEARRRGLVTIALVGYDGGRVAVEGLADHVVVTRSQNIPRIQEAQASAYHALRELIE